MAIVTLLGQTFNTTSGSHTVVATPTAGSLIVIITASTGSVATTTCTDNNPTNTGAFVTVNTAVKVSSADIMMLQIRTTRIASNASTTFTHAPGTTTGGGLIVYQVTGMTKVGTAASKQSAIQSNTASATPAPVLGGTPLLTNPIIGAVFNGTNPATMTPRTKYTEDADVGYITPTTGFEAMHLTANEGETSATITWGSVSATEFASVVVELDFTLQNQFNNYMGFDVSGGGTGEKIY